MTRPRGGRLPRDITLAAGITRTVFIPISHWNGVTQGQWIPRATSESVSYIWYDPDYDVGNALNVRVHWYTPNATDANSVTFRVRYARLTVDTTAVALGTTALDTVIAADNPSTTANSYMRTEAGVLNGGTVTDGQALSLQLDVSATSGLTLGSDSASRVVVVGVELEYVATNL